jgi:hypothetical protein
VVAKDVGTRKNGAKTQLAQEYSFTCPRVKLRSKHLWVKGSCWGKGIKLELVDKAWAHKKNSCSKFSHHLLKSAWVKSTFPYALSPHHEGAKRDTIEVVRGTTTKQSHCMGHVLTYPMENEMPFCTSHRRAMGMWLYNQGQQRIKWKDPRTSNVETHVQALYM